MANGAYLFQGGAADGISAKIANSTVTVIAGNANYRTNIVWFGVQENTGAGTPNLTVEKYDGTTSIYLGSGGFAYKAKAMTAGQSVEFVNGYLLNKGEFIRVTSSDALGKLDVIGLIAISPGQ